MGQHSLGGSECTILLFSIDVCVGAHREPTSRYGITFTVHSIESCGASTRMMPGTVSDCALYAPQTQRRQLMARCTHLLLSTHNRLQR